jgi:hypothetical protein
MSAPIDGGAGATSLFCAKDDTVGISNSKNPRDNMKTFSI